MSISAFGIDHDAVAKSQLSPGVFKPISSMTPLQRTKVKRRLVEAPKSPGYGPTRGQSSAGRKLWEGHTTPAGRAARVVEVKGNRKTPLGSGAGANYKAAASAMPNGRRGGTLVFYNGNKANKTVARHEWAHMNVKRNVARAQERFADPIRLGREEGRADFLAHGRQTPDRYPGTPAFKSGYNEVQAKMMRAKYRKLDRKPFGKSYVPKVGYKPALELLDSERAMIGRRVSRPTKSKFEHPPNKGLSRKLSSKWRKGGFPALDGSKEITVENKIPRRSRLFGAVSGKKLEGQAFLNGRGGGHIIVDGRMKGRQYREALKHEEAHLKPRRNPVNAQFRMRSSSRRLGREEGRADFIASGKPTQGQYPGDQDFQMGYFEVQSKMNRAKHHKKRSA